MYDLLVIRAKLYGCYIQLLHNTHMEIIKEESYMHLVEREGIHEEEVIIVVPLSMEQLLVPLTYHQLGQRVMTYP